MANKIANSQQFLDTASYVRSEAQFMGLPGAGIREMTKETGVASALKLNRVFPINLSYRFGGGVNSLASTQRDSSQALKPGAAGASQPTSLEFQKASGAIGLNKKLVAARHGGSGIVDT